MADESTTVTQDTGNDIGDVSLDRFNDVEETVETTDTEATTEQVDDAADEEQERTPDADEQDDTEAETESEDEKSDDTEEEAPKQRLSRKEYAERARQEREQQQQLERQVEQTIDQVYAPQSIEELQERYLEAGYTEGEALILARQDHSDQKTQIAEAKAEIVQLNANLQVDAFEARSTYDWMNPDKVGKGYSETAHKAAAQLYEHMIATDERTGQVVDAKLTPKQLAQVIETIRQDAIKEATAKARKDAEAELANVAPATSARQPVKPGNSLRDMEDRLANIKF